MKAEGMPMANLYIYPKSGEPSSVPLAGQRVTIGRASTNDIVLSDQFSSGCHAVVVPTESGYAIITPRRDGYEIVPGNK